MFTVQPIRLFYVICLIIGNQHRVIQRFSQYSQLIGIGQLENERQDRGQERESGQRAAGSDYSMVQFQTLVLNDSLPQKRISARGCHLSTMLKTYCAIDRVRGWLIIRFVDDTFWAGFIACKIHVL